MPRWGKVAAANAGQIMVDTLRGRTLRFVSVGRLTVVWDSPDRVIPPGTTT